MNRTYGSHLSLPKSWIVEFHIAEYTDRAPARGRGSVEVAHPECPLVVL
jgi:hypothetical protein